MRLPMPFAAFLLLVTGLGAGSCRTTQPQSGLQDANGASAQASQMVAMIDRGCGVSSGCHNSGQNHQVSLAQLKTFAQQTKTYYACFQQNNCFTQPTDPTAAKTCWQQCLQAGGGLNLDGGVFQAAIRGGIVRQIATSGGGDPTLLDGNAMPPTAPTPDTDVTADPAKFQALAQFLASQVDNNYADLTAVRGPTATTQGGPDPAFDNTCDSATHSSSAISSLINANFNMTSYVPDIQMFGCTQAWPDNPSTCLGAFQPTPFADSGTPGLVVKQMRALAGQPRTLYWMRSSADGRFSSTGNGNIQDLATDGRVLPVTGATFDPVYAPNNKLYAWPAMTCPQAPLYDPTVTAVGPDQAASGCQNQNVGVYRSLGGLDPNQPALAITGYTNNNPCDPSSGTIDSIDMAGGGFEIDQMAVNGITQGQVISTPNEVDYQMAPAQTLLVGRFLNSTNGNQQSYRIRAEADPTNPAKTAVICMKGEKANISYDSRFVAFHHWSDGSPQDQGTTPKVANVFVYDLLTHQSMRVTNMPANSYACFPHFRADGWLYFMVKQFGANNAVTESVVASNAAILMKAATGVQGGAPAAGAQGGGAPAAGAQDGTPAASAPGGTPAASAPGGGS